MDLFSNFKIKTKFIIVFSTLSLIVLIVGGKGLISSRDINNGSKEIYETRLMSVNYLKDIKGNLNDTRAIMIQILYEKDTLKLQMHLDNVDKLTQEDIRFMEAYEKLSSTDEEKRYMQNLKQI